MTKKDVLELKRRLKKTECTFTKLSGCYVDCNKEIITYINETFLNLEEEEFYKYLEIARKTMSGTFGNNLLELEFPLEEESVGGRQHSLLALKTSKLKDQNLLDSFYQLVINSYDYSGNYLILLFHDAYDVMTKTSDNSKLDESEEVYEYILCAICPVSLSKAGLGYREDEHRIGARIRDWVVDAPENGFIFPAFTDRSTDIHSVLYFAKNAKEPHREFMEDGLGCPAKQTATEQKVAFHGIVKKALGEDEETSNHLYMEIQETLNNMVEIQDNSSDDSDPILLTNDSIQKVLTDCGIPEEVTAKIERSYTEEFKDTPPVVEHLLEPKLLAAHEQKKKEQALVKQVQDLTRKLEETKNKAMLDEVIKDFEENTEEDFVDTTSYDIVVRVKPEKVTKITSQVIDGQKCIIIPLDEDEQANVNGIDTIY